MGKHFIILILLLLAGPLCFAQDIIIKKNNEQIKVKVIEISPEEVKFRYYDTPDGPTIVMKRKDIKSIKLQGSTETIVMNEEADPMSTSNDLIEDKTSSLKFQFFSPLNRHLAFHYEWMIKPGFNWEAGIGIVGPGTSVTGALLNDKASGFFLRTGPKFLLGNSSDIEINGARYAHPLKGRYFKTEVILYSIKRSWDRVFYSPGGNSNERIENTYTGAALNLIYGRQVIFGNMVTVGWYAGGGYGFESYTTNTPSTNNSYYSDFSPKRYSHSYFGKDFPVTLTAGFNIGYIFKTPQWVDRIAHRGPSNTPPSRHSVNK